MRALTLFFDNTNQRVYLKLNFNILNLDSKLKKEGLYGFIIFSSDSKLKPTCMIACYHNVL